MTTAFNLTMTDGIATIVFDQPGEKVNTLSKNTLEKLEGVFDELKNNSSVKALVIKSQKKDIFIAGADIKEFEPAFKERALGLELIETGQRVFNKLAALPFPTIAVIDGACLGGGLELALSCRFRVVTDNPKTALALPETSLGIIPGYGGTQRLPRLVGLQNGIEMIISGKPVKAVKAYKIKLADKVISREFLDPKTEDFIKEVLDPKSEKKLIERRQLKGWRHWLLEKNPIGRALLFYKAKKEILKKTKGFYPAPLIALDLIEKTTNSSLEKGLKAEKEAFVNNSQDNLDIARNLIRIFFGQDALKKNGGLSEALPKGKEIPSAAVIGAGTMGGGISWLFSNASIPVRMKDINWDAIGKGIGTSWSVYFKLLKSRRLNASEASLKFHELSYTLDYKGFQNKAIVIESAVENLELKKKIYEELETVIPETSIIATNTSSLTISALSEGLKRPERFIGMHFFNPATKMPLVEIIPSKTTSQEALSATMDLAKKLGKVPLVVGDCTAFLVNRIFCASANEAMQFLVEGVPIETLDEVMLKFGMPMGPCELADEVGIDVSYKVGKICETAYGERMHMPKLLEQMYEHKLLGKKNGKGFYIWSGKEKKLNMETKKILDGLTHIPRVFSPDDISHRIMLAMINEAARCLEEKVVRLPEHVDLAMVLGTGFPPFRGGPLTFADKLGIQKVLNDLKAQEQAEGPRFKPALLIEEMAQNNRSFYSALNKN